jgi:hypothetical protein
MKNKLFLARIIIILIFAIVGMGCDGGVDIGGGGGSGGGLDGGGSGGDIGGSGGSGGGNDADAGGSGGSGDSGGDVVSDGDVSGGSGSGDRDYEDNRGGSVIYIWGNSGSGRSRSRHTVKFKVIASNEPSGSSISGVPVSITYSYPDENFSWSTGSSGTITNTFQSVLPWEKSVSISEKVIGNGIRLKASVENTSIWLTAEIYIDGKKKSSSYGKGDVSVDYY